MTPCKELMMLPEYDAAILDTFIPREDEPMTNGKRREGLASSMSRPIRWTQRPVKDDLDPEYRCRGVERDDGKPACDGPNVQRYCVHIPADQEVPERLPAEDRETELCDECVSERRDVGWTIARIGG